jgi:hypothetical protein
MTSPSYLLALKFGFGGFENIYGILLLLKAFDCPNLVTPLRFIGLTLLFVDLSMLFSFERDSS